MRVFLLLALLSSAVADAPGLSGSVLAPDGTPVSTGRVIVGRSAFNRNTTTIDRSGHFSQALETEGPVQVWIVVPGLAPYRFNLIVPASRTVKLPPITLSPATYFKVRFVTADEEPILSPALQRRSVDSEGRPIPDFDDPPADQIERDGTITIGPLPRGITMLAANVPPLAQQRLSVLTIDGKKTLLDGGVIALTPGAVLVVDIVDEMGAPVAAHDVWLDDVAAPRTPLSFRPAKTDPGGRARFDRVGQGRYRVWTLAKDRCRSQTLSLVRNVSVGSGGVVSTRIVVGGQATFRVESQTGAIMGRTVTASLDAGSAAPPWQNFASMAPIGNRVVVMPNTGSACSGATDADGRVTLKTFPPGSANVQLRLLNSTYVKRLPVPAGGGEVVLTIPDGLISVVVANQATNQPIANAKVVWTGDEGRVEAFTNGGGNALIEAAGTTGGRLSISAENFETLEANFTELPSSGQEVLLPPLPPTRLQLAVAGVDGAPLPNAVVEFVPSNPIDISTFAGADPKGVVTFTDLPRGTLRFRATAEGFVAAEAHVAEDARGSTRITLKRVIE